MINKVFKNTLFFVIIDLVNKKDEIYEIKI